MGATGMRRGPATILSFTIVGGVIATGAAATALQGVPVFAPPAAPVGGGSASPAPSPSAVVPLPIETLEPSAPPEPSALSSVEGALWVLALGLLILALSLGARSLIKRRRRPPRLLGSGASTQDGHEDVVTPERMRRGIDGALDVLRSDRVTSDAIVTAWVGLEEAALDGGMRRGVSETPAEFAHRIITRTASVQDAAGTLLEQYQRVRFGGEGADEADRARCIDALRTIREAWS